MDTSENRPENEVPEPPLPVADQVSNDERPEGSAEEEEKKEVTSQATCWGGWAERGPRENRPSQPSLLHRGMTYGGQGRALDQERAPENSLV